MPGSGNGLKGLRIVSFESRRAEDMAVLIRRYGGEPLSAPSMREIPLDQNKEALEFAGRLFKGEIDILILLTGVGTRVLVDAVSTRYPRDDFIQAIGRVVTVVRGPKPAAALRQMGLEPSFRVPEPNTWRDLLDTLERECPVKGKRVAVQEYGKTNSSLMEGLHGQGAEIFRIPVYRWGLPEDVEPLKEAIQEILEGRTDAALFTSANQVDNLFHVARIEGVEARLGECLAKSCVASIGPITTESLARVGVRSTMEPSSPHMGVLVKELSELMKKRKTERPDRETGR